MPALVGVFVVGVALLVIAPCALRVGENLRDKADEALKAEKAKPEVAKQTA